MMKVKGFKISIWGCFSVWGLFWDLVSYVFPRDFNRKVKRECRSFIIKVEGVNYELAMHSPVDTLPTPLPLHLLLVFILRLVMLKVHLAGKLSGQSQYLGFQVDDENKGV